jgi:L-rhamnose mutarotase
LQLFAEDFRMGRMKTRGVMLSQLKPECLERYRHYHDNIWPGLMDSYRRSGVSHISCFLSGLTLVVYLEYDDHYPIPLSPEDKALQDKWLSLMHPMKDPAYQIENFEEIFNMAICSDKTESTLTNG